RDEVDQREPVVGSDVIYARVRALFPCAVKVARPAYPVGHVRDDALVAPPEAPYGVPVPVVPLGPGVGEVPCLVAAGAEVPGLGYELYPGEDGVAGYFLKELVRPVVIGAVPEKDGGEVEPEAV